MANDTIRRLQAKKKTQTHRNAKQKLNIMSGNVCDEVEMFLISVFFFLVLFSNTTKCVSIHHIRTNLNGMSLKRDA